MKHYFGKAKKAYSVATVRKLFKKHGLERAQTYLRKHFARLTNGSVACWSVSTNSYTTLSAREAREVYFNESLNVDIQCVTVTVRNNEKTEKTKTKTQNLGKWFLTETPLYRVDMDPRAARIWTNDVGEHCLNLFSGFQYKYQDPETFDDHAKEVVKRYWNHVREVICNNNEDIFQFMKLWIAHCCTGHKVTTCVYLRSVQGTGKSITFEPIKRCVGQGFWFDVEKPDTFTGKFNGQLSGKLFVLGEEMPSVSKQGFQCLANAMKSPITSDFIQIEFKGQNSRTERNFCNYALCSNKECLKLESGDRRFLKLEVCTLYIGNHEYFNRLAELFDKPEYMALLFSQCVDLVKEHPNWNSQAHMKTLKLRAKDDQIVAHLPPLTQYIKEEYLESGDISGMDITCADLLADYNMMNPTRKIPTKAKLGVEMKKMSEILQAKTVRPKGGKPQKRYRISYKELYDLFKSKKWISEEYDDVTPPEELESLDSEDDSPNPLDAGSIQNNDTENLLNDCIAEGNLQLQTENDQLKQQLEQLQEQIKQLQTQLQTHQPPVEAKQTSSDDSLFIEESTDAESEAEPEEPPKKRTLSRGKKLDGPTSIEWNFE